MTHKYKVGDKVRILDGSTIKNYEFSWASPMRKYIGSEVTITKCVEGRNYPAYSCDDLSYKWDERGLELINNDIKDVIFNGPATIVIWSDDSKTVVKLQEGDIFDKEKGLALCIAKKYLGNKSNYNNVFKKWIGKDNL